MTCKLLVLTVNCLLLQRVAISEQRKTSTKTSALHN